MSGSIGAPNLVAVGIHGLAIGTTIIVTPATPFRIWAVSLLFSFQTSNTFAGGQQGIYARMLDTPGNVLAALDHSIGSPNQQGTAVVSLQMPGLVEAGGNSISVDVNAGVNISQCFMRAACTVYYSVP